MTDDPSRQQTIAVAVSSTASTVRLSGGSHPRWVKATTVGRGPLEVTRRSSAEARADAAEAVGRLLDEWAEPVLVGIDGHAGVCYPQLAGDRVTWAYRIVCPDGSRGGSQGGYSSNRAAELGLRLHLSQYVTDYGDDTDVLRVAGFLADEQRRDHLRYAAWQRARIQAATLGVADPHRWAGEHQGDHLPALEAAYRAALGVDRPPDPAL